MCSLRRVYCVVHCVVYCVVHYVVYGVVHCLLSYKSVAAMNTCVHVCARMPVSACVRVHVCTYSYMFLWAEALS